MAVLWSGARAEDLIDGVIPTLQPSNHLFPLAGHGNTKNDDSHWTITLKAGPLCPSGLPIRSTHKLISACPSNITDINPEERDIYIQTSG